MFIYLLYIIFIMYSHIQYSYRQSIRGQQRVREILDDNCTRFVIFRVGEGSFSCKIFDDQQVFLEFYLNLFFHIGSFISLRCVLRTRAVVCTSFYDEIESEHETHQ